MPAVSTANPGSIASAFIGSNSYLTADDGDSAYFHMKVVRARWRGGSPSADTTGDGDAVHERQNNRILQGGLILSGFALSGKVVGVENIIVPAKNPVTIRIYTHSDTRWFDGTWIIDWAVADWARASPYVAISLQCSMTSTTSSGIES